MKAWVLRQPNKVDLRPLKLDDVPIPQPSADEVLVQVHACGICRTDLHVLEGDLKPRRPAVIPGHQIVGIVEAMGANVSEFMPGDRVGIAWLNRTCGSCEFCRGSRENLCDRAEFTGWSVNGGYAEFAIAPA